MSDQNINSVITVHSFTLKALSIDQSTEVEIEIPDIMIYLPYIYIGHINPIMPSCFSKVTQEIEYLQYLESLKTSHLL